MEDWMLNHMQGVLIFVEVLWVAGFLAVFVLYFLIRRKIKKNRELAVEATEENGEKG